MIDEGIRLAVEGSGLGLRRGLVVVADPDRAWPELFGRLAVELRRILPSAAVAIEHVGSTSIEGLSAKPIIDVAIGIKPGGDDEAVRASLEAAGLIYRGDGSGTGLDAMYGLEIEPLVRMANLHLVEYQGLQWNAYLAYRDSLRDSAERRDAYAALKRDLAARHPDDRSAYLEGKSDFIVDELHRSGQAAARKEGQMNDSARVYRAREVSKPWGSEQVFAEIDDVYVGKVIRVRAGESLSLQFHNEKTETICVVTGRAAIDFGGDQHSLESAELGPGDTIHLPAGALHRITALEDLVFAEVSTAHGDWRNDVVRLEDRYGRSGTSAP